MFSLRNEYVVDYELYMNYLYTSLWAFGLCIAGFRICKRGFRTWTLLSTFPRDVMGSHENLARSPGLSPRSQNNKA